MFRQFRRHYAITEKIAKEKKIIKHINYAQDAKRNWTNLIKTWLTHQETTISRLLWIKPIKCSDNLVVPQKL